MTVCQIQMFISTKDLFTNESLDFLEYGQYLKLSVAEVQQYRLQMATAQTISPSDEKANYLRRQALLVDGGTLVLRHLIETKYPGKQWDAHLATQSVRDEIKRMKDKKVIANDQFELLYPPFGSTDRGKYDISLLVCLLRNVCGLNSHSIVWNVVPSSKDVSEEADIRRLNIERNELSHGTTTSMTKQHFEVRWTYIEEALMRLGKNIPGLKQNIDNLKGKSIDPEQERVLMDTIHAWEELDKTMQENIQELKLTVSQQGKELDTLKHDCNSLMKQTEIITADLSSRVTENEECLQNVEDHSKKIEKQVHLYNEEIKTLTEKIDGGKSSHDVLEGKLFASNISLSRHVHETDQRLQVVERSTQDTADVVNRMSETQKSLTSAIEPTELKNLASITQMFLEDCLSDEVYVRTKLHTEAKEKLIQNNVVVLSGNPGEGKTSMAMKLMLEMTSADKCLKLAQPSDWRLVDFEIFDTIFIDDIFGPGILEEKLVKSWNKHLPEIWKSVQKKHIKVIITTRHYILEEARKSFNRSAVFQAKHIQYLSSKDLSIDERKQILAAHIKNKELEIDNYEALIDGCVAFSSSFLNTVLTGEPSFLFGFPECVKMFAHDDDLFKRGPEFFSNPNTFFRNCLEDLREDEEKFLALLVIWSRQNKTLFQSDLELSSISKEISDVLEMFGFKLKGKLLKSLRSSLKHHTNGFLRYIPSVGAYKFSHNVISDMVGLVISQDNPEACLEYTDKEFLLAYITIADHTDDFRFFVEEHLHNKLMHTFIRVASIPSSEISLIDLLILKRGGRRPNKVNFFSEADVEVFFHDAFSDLTFVKKFVAFFVKSNNVERFLSKPVMTMKGYFLSYGFELEKVDIFLPSYLLFHSSGILFKELLRQSVLASREDLQNEMFMALLISAHENHVDIVKVLIEYGASVTEEAIYVAAVNQHIEILQFLLKNVKGKASTRCKIEKNNNALMVCTKMGLVESIKLLVTYIDVSLRNDLNVSALDKAVIFKREEICRVLIENHAPINEKGGKFKRTPLHTASDIGLPRIVEMLLRAGARTNIKDHRGHYPIHCAVIQNHTEVVRILISHDKSQAKLRIASYGKSSRIRGMTVFHVAVWKKNVGMIKTLLEESQECNVRDWFGRTPLYCASFDGITEIVDLLLPYADPNLPDKHGYTPLHAAIHRSHEDIFMLLLPHSNVNARDKFGSSPLHAACRGGFCDIVEKLVKADSNPLAVTKRERTAFHFLQRNRFDTLFNILQELLNLQSDPRPVRDFNACVQILRNYISK